MKCYKCGETNHTMSECKLRIRIPSKPLKIEWTCPICGVEYREFDRAQKHDDACSKRNRGSMMIV